MLKINYEVNTTFSKIAGSKTATFLKMSLLFLDKYIFRIQPKLLWPS